MRRGLRHRLENIKSVLDTVLEARSPGGNAEVILQEVTSQHVEHVKGIPGRRSGNGLRAWVKVTVVPEASESVVGGRLLLVTVLIALRREIRGGMTERCRSGVSGYSQVLQIDVSDELGERAEGREATTPFALYE